MIFTRINRKEAEKQFANGQKIYLLASNLSLNGFGGVGASNIQRETENPSREFIEKVNAYRNMMCSDITGNKVTYYVGN